MKPTLLSNSTLRRYTELPYLMDYLKTRELAMLNPKTWDDRNDSYYIEQFAKASDVKGIYAICLSQSAETYHHWKVFASGSGGVCIEFDRAKFRGHAQKVAGLVAKSVDYRTIDKMQINLPEKADFPFLKRYAFSDENEFRLIMATPEYKNAVFRIKIPLSAIDHIVLSPWLPPTVEENVKTTLKQIKGCSRLKIHRSTLVENENWKNFAQAGHSHSRI